MTNSKNKLLPTVPVDVISFLQYLPTNLRNNIPSVGTNTGGCGNTGGGDNAESGANAGVGDELGRSDGGATNSVAANATWASSWLVIAFEVVFGALGWHLGRDPLVVCLCCAPTAERRLYLMPQV